MPKVSTQTIKAYQKDISKEFKLSLIYNSDLGFHIEIPSEFFEVVKHLSNLSELSIVRIAKSRNRVSEFKYFVVAESESLCVINTKKCLEYLIDKAIVKRDVIIVFFNPKDTCTYNEHAHNKEHPQIGMQFGLTYAVETSIGEKKVYSLYTERTWLNGNVQEFRKEIYLYGKASTIIPDTPESREMLESLYNAFVSLNEKLKLFTQTPESLLDFIQSKVRLLN